MAQVDKISGSRVGQRIAEEASPGVLPATPVWRPREVNEYGDYGADPTLTSRTPIEPSRQRKKGEVTNITVPAVYQLDVVQEALQDDFQGFMFADLRRKNELAVVGADDAADEFDVVAEALSAAIAAGGTGYSVGDVLTLVGGTSTEVATFQVDTVAAGVVTAVSVVAVGAYSVVPTDPVSTTVAPAGGTGCTLNVSWFGGEQYVAGDILFVKNVGTNNGKFVAAGGGTPNTVPVAEDITVAEAGQSGTVSRVGYQFAADDLEIENLGTEYPKIKSTAKDFTTLGLIPGELLFTGDDGAAFQFTNAVNNQRWRIRSIAAGEIVCDKSDGTAITETTSGGETVRLFWCARVLKNEADPSLQVKRTYQLERDLGAPDDSAPASKQYDYIPGSVANQAVIAFNPADKLTVEFSYVGQKPDYRTSAEGPKSGTRPSIVPEKFLNISTDVKRAKISVISDTDAAPTPLVNFLQELTLTVNNNVQENGALGVLGSCSNTEGPFDVDGSATGYYNNIAVQESVLDNDDVTLDLHLVKDQRGFSLDLPLVGLGDGRPTVTRTDPITVPLTSEAVSGEYIDQNLNHTLLLGWWDYLPLLADT